MGVVEGMLGVGEGESWGGVGLCETGCGEEGGGGSGFIYGWGGFEEVDENEFVREGVE